ncbi:E3 ubiquitin-protein ligase RNF115-like [Corticium candelabrum]|uniref:E3 ubiquitin-protein ligase RNF115-like n=1 Tax=Corticium candelabrum TaxID=121492 RepID=UPI002E259B03|nr:E3 ubiquitin-protein ligase RNF115-like [Corticium candelabrum]
MAQSQAVSTDVLEKLFYCHECEKEIKITISDDDPTCPDCNHEFLEALDEQEEPNRGEGDGEHSPTDAELQESLSWRMATIDPATGLPRNPMDVIVNSLMEATSANNRGSWPPAPLLRIQERRRRMRPVHVRTVLHGPPTLLRVANDLVGGSLSGGFPFPFPLHNIFGGPRNLGDYVTSDRSLDDVVSQLLSQLEGGAPPADKETIDSLPKVIITQDVVDKNVECTICQDKYTVREEVHQLTKCQHLFHTGCITPWLKLHDTCPVCRIPVSDRASESTAGLPSQNVFMSGGRNQYEQYDESSDMGSEEVN